MAAIQRGSIEGASYQPKSGKYFLNINADGNWRVKIVEIKDEEYKGERKMRESQKPQDKIEAMWDCKNKDGYWDAITDACKRK